MEFRTELLVKPAAFTFGLTDGVITIGSCFADEIGNRLHHDKFNVLPNPFGTVYNPVSIHKLLEMAIRQEAPRLDGYCQREGIFVHHDFHSSFSDVNQNVLASKLIAQLKTVHQALKTSNVLIITYGTAWAYQQKSAKQVVANCHKIPQHQFDKFLITQKQMLESFEHVENLLRAFNPFIQVMVTVSPVRHLKDTLELNSVSKSILRLACHSMTKIFQHVSYFPAYEIMLDDLRDYRFYKSDLIHPTEFAVDYIWQKFSDTYLSADTKTFLTRWNKIKSGLQHRAFNPSSEQHQEFLKRLDDEMKSLGF